MEKKYLVIEGIDGSGSSYTYENLIKTGKFSVLPKGQYERLDELNDDSFWWEKNKDIVKKRLDFYITRNFNQNSTVKKILANENIVQLKSLITTIIVHSYFMNKNFEEVLNSLNLKDYKIPNITFFIYSSSSVREKRFIERTKSGSLTEFDKITLKEDYINYFFESLQVLINKKSLGEILLLNNDLGNLFEEKIEKLIKKHLDIV